MSNPLMKNFNDAPRSQGIKIANRTRVVSNNSNIEASDTSGHKSKDFSSKISPLPDQQSNLLPKSSKRQQRQSHEW